MDYIQLESKLKNLEEAVKSHRQSLNDIEKLIDEKTGGLKDIISGDKKKTLPLPHVQVTEECSAAVGLGLQAKSDVNVREDIHNLTMISLGIVFSTNRCSTYTNC